MFFKWISFKNIYFIITMFRFFFCKCSKNAVVFWTSKKIMSRENISEISLFLLPLIWFPNFVIWQTFKLIPINLLRTNTHVDSNKIIKALIGCKQKPILNFTVDINGLRRMCHWIERSFRPQCNYLAFVLLSD